MTRNRKVLKGDRPLAWIPAAGEEPGKSPDEFVELFRRWRQGDEAALEEILWNTKPLVDGFCRRPVRDQEGLNSALWGAVLKAVNIWKGKPHGPGCLGWIAFCTRGLRFRWNRHCRHIHRVAPGLGWRHRDVVLNAPKIYNDSDDKFENDTDLDAALWVLPEEGKADVKALINRFLPKLPTANQRTIRALFFEGKTLKEAARPLKQTRQAVSISLTVALRRLRNMMLIKGIRLEDYLSAGHKVARRKKRL